MDWQSIVDRIYHWRPRRTDGILHWLFPRPEDVAQVNGADHRNPGSGETAYARGIIQGRSVSSANNNLRSLHGDLPCRGRGGDGHLAVLGSLILTVRLACVPRQLVIQRKHYS